MFELGKKDDSESGAGNGSQANDQRSDSRRQSRGAAGSSAGGGVAAIGRSIRINGDLEGEEDLRIDGEVKGTVRLKKNAVVVGCDGKIHADVYAKTVAVEGAVEGDLFGAEQVSIRKSATVKGNITAPRVSLEDGAHFKGSIEMDPEAVRAALGDAAIASSSTKPATPKPTPIAASKVNGDVNQPEKPIQAAKG
ncbi:MAG: bactofilin family protein [Gammaproteobacteria bacterium]